jgi:hypothetical protein
LKVGQQVGQIWFPFLAFIVLLPPGLFFSGKKFGSIGGPVSSSPHQTVFSF